MKNNAKMAQVDIQRQLYRIRIDNLPKHLKKWFLEIEHLKTDSFVRAINEIYDSSDDNRKVERLLTNLRNEYWYHKDFFCEHWDVFESNVHYYKKESQELKDELIINFEKNGFTSEKAKRLLNYGDDLLTEMIKIFEKEPNLKEDEFIKKIYDITYEKTIIGHGDGWDESGKHFIIPYIENIRVLKIYNEEEKVKAFNQIINRMKKS